MKPPSIHLVRSLYLRALGIPFAGVLDYATFLANGCEVFSPTSANDDPHDYPPDGPKQGEKICA